MNISYEELQKEIFLLEHGFYDKEVRNFAKTSSIEILGTKLSEWVEWHNISFWIDDARKEWFKKHKLEG